MLSKPGAGASDSPPEGQPARFRSQRRPTSPSSTSTARRRRALPTTAGTDVATALSPVGHRACDPEAKPSLLAPSLAVPMAPESFWVHPLKKVLPQAKVGPQTCGVTAPGWTLPGRRQQ